jgi:hypothetical protein
MSQILISLGGHPESEIRDPFNEFQAREKEILEELKKLNLSNDPNRPIPNPPANRDRETRDTGNNS